MMTSSNGNIFRVTGPLCGEFPHKGQWRGALMFTLICARIKGWVNNREAGDLGRYLGHYDVTVMRSNVDTIILVLPQGHNSIFLEVDHLVGENCVSSVIQFPCWYAFLISIRLWCISNPYFASFYLMYNGRKTSHASLSGLCILQ